jgi:hypothetical protein
MKNPILWLICGAFILFGAIAGVSTVHDVRKGLQSEAWPIAEGTVLRAQKRRGRSKLKRFEYEYSVSGETYLSTRAAFVRVPYMRPLHRTYQAGQSVDVRYDPADPSQAVIEPGVPVLGLFAEALVPLLLIAMGGAGLYYGAFRR